MVVLDADSYGTCIIIRIFRDLHPKPRFSFQGHDIGQLCNTSCLAWTDTMLTLLPNQNRYYYRPPPPTPRLLLLLGYDYYYYYYYYYHRHLYYHCHYYYYYYYYYYYEFYLYHNKMVMIILMTAKLSLFSLSPSS